MKYLLLMLFLVPNISYGAFGDILNTDTDSCFIGGGGSCTITVPATTADSLLLVWGRDESSGLTGASDASNGTWTTDLQLSTCGEFLNRNCTAVHVEGSAASVVTVTLIGTGCFCTAYVHYIEYAGADTTAALDAKSTDVGTYGASWTSPSVTPTASINALLVGVAQSNDTANTYTGSDGSTTRVSGDTGSWSMAIQDKIISSTSGSYTVSGTVSVGGASGALLIFKAAAAGATTLPHIYFRGKTIIRGKTIFR